MANDLLAAAALLWIAAAVLALTGRALGLVRALLGLGGLAAIIAAIITLPLETTPVAVPLRMAGEMATFLMPPDALWLMGFGLAPAILACLLGTPSQEGRAGWLFGAHAACLELSVSSAYSTQGFSSSRGS